MFSVNEMRGVRCAVVKYDCRSTVDRAPQNFLKRDPSSVFFKILAVLHATPRIKILRVTLFFRIPSRIIIATTFICRPQTRERHELERIEFGRARSPRHIDDPQNLRVFQIGCVRNSW